MSIFKILSLVILKVTVIKRDFRGGLKLPFRKKKNTRESDEDFGQKKLGLFRRLWKKFRNIDWKNPVNRWKLLVISLVVFVGLIGFVGGAIALTNSPAFCKTCHEMAPEHVTFEASSHNQITCVQCHIKPGNVNMVMHKVESLKEVYYHITGVPDPIVQTVAVLDENCKQCHTDKRMITPGGDLTIKHKEHIKENIPCITCHSGVVHAKVVERGINGSTTYDKWTTKNGDKLMGSEYMKPNMGTCIDCHTQVNQGKKPWEDYSYSIPENPHEEEHGTADAGKKEEYTKKEIKAQDVIFETINSQKQDVKLSMECSSCHQKENTPINHQNVDWNKNHGSSSIKELDNCLNCHEDSKWNKTFEKQDLKQLLNSGTKKEKSVVNMEDIKQRTRQNSFCNDCHEKEHAKLDS